MVIFIRHLCDSWFSMQVFDVASLRFVLAPKKDEPMELTKKNKKRIQESN